MDYTRVWVPPGIDVSLRVISAGQVRETASITSDITISVDYPLPVYSKLVIAPMGLARLTELPSSRLTIVPSC